MTPVFGLALGVALLVGLLLGSRVLQVRAKLHPETARKLVHVGTGLIALSFPWLLRETWAVMSICALSIAVLLGLRRLGALRQRVGGVLHDVKRHSGGDLYFLIAVALLWVLSQGDALLYVIPLVVLTFADGLAALTGVTYGRTKYQAADGFKSVEGSVAFAAITFLATHIPLLLLSDVGRAESLVIAALVAILTMLVEAISWEGMDNILVPLAVFIAVNGHRHVSLDMQLQHLGSIGLLGCIVFALRRRMPLTAGALASAALGLYLCLTLGSAAWLLAPVITGTVAVGLYWLHQVGQVRPTLPDYGVQVIVSLSIPALLWLLTVRFIGQGPALYAFSVCWAAQLAGLGIFNRQFNDLEAPMHPVSAARLATGAPLTLLVLLPWLIWQGGQWPWLLAGLGAAGLCLLACAGLAAKQKLNLPRQVVLLGLSGPLAYAAAMAL